MPPFFNKITHLKKKKFYKKISFDFTKKILISNYIQVNEDRPQMA